MVVQSERTGIVDDRPRLLRHSSYTGRRSFTFSTSSRLDIRIVLPVYDLVVCRRCLPRISASSPVQPLGFQHPCRGGHVYLFEVATQIYSKIECEWNQTALFESVSCLYGRNYSEFVTLRTSVVCGGDASVSFHASSASPSNVSACPDFL